MITGSRALALGAVAGVLIIGLSAGSLEISPDDAGVRLDRVPRGPGSSGAPERLAAESERPEVGVGDEAPEFDLPVIRGTGERVALADLRGREDVLLVVWAAWCPPCIDEFTELKRLHAAYGDRGLRILAVGVRFHESVEDVKEFARDQELPFTVLYDEEEKVVQRYGVTYIPSNYLIDRGGVIRFSSNGLPSDFETTVESALASIPAAPAPEMAASH